MFNYCGVIYSLKSDYHIRISKDSVNFKKHNKVAFDLLRRRIIEVRK